MRTFLVGRRNSRQPCDIQLPESESSVSRKHLELSVTDDGKFYIVHLHPKNRTEVYRGGVWESITQDFVDPDDPLRLGLYESTARKLVAMVGNQPDSAQLQDDAFEWDPDRGSFRKPGI